MVVAVQTQVTESCQRRVAVVPLSRSMCKGLSLQGITIINISLTAAKLFATDSPLLELDK
ncbi:hypothetical protein NECAME_04353 [Necator americanus]|uniref:Uncharacterized protein n=1 Tax=Necator americanus TaxID=51031 RepID=W2STT5_NECAM|nr:hypothetical protein NECAME_04353 [Necator americanus]ETN73045.1 hypothetical protein NECAME_04353 [Necator americanus]